MQFQIGDGYGEGWSQDECVYDVYRTAILNGDQVGLYVEGNIHYPPPPKLPSLDLVEFTIFC